MNKIALHWQIFIGLFAGILFGYLLPEYVPYISWMGTVFLKFLKMIIIPLLLFSVMAGILNVGNPAGLGRLGMKTIAYYAGTSLAAICTGLLMVNLMQPGVGADLGLNQPVEGLAAAGEDFGKTLINIIPENIVLSLAQGEMLSVIFVSILFGIFATQLADQYKGMVVKGVNAGFELMMKVTHFIIRFTPLGVMGIIAVVVADNVGEDGALGSVFLRLGKYMLTVIIALGIHALITLPLIMRFVGKINPLKHFNAMATPLITAFSTSSSSATLPLTLHAMENKAGVSNKVSSFVLPLGATINMDGTALYECVAAMFIAQAYGVELGPLQQVIVVFTALLASIGAAGIPMAGLVMISVVLSAVGLPLEGVGLIIAVDRVLDMFRTSVNVWSDTTGAAVIAHTEGEQLRTAIKS
jgi:proton glutamate symport protein